MAIRTVGILHPGDMGHAVGAVLGSHGLRVVAALDERSERTRGLAAKAGIEDLGTLDRLVTEADLVLSILVPAAAEEQAEQVATALRATGAQPLYADCNAIAPAATVRIGERITAAGGRYLDASIIGPPPRRPGTTRIYASGAAASELAELGSHCLEIRVLGTRIGQASGLKMCYGSLTKGLAALATSALVAAERLELDEPLRRELAESQPMLLDWFGTMLPNMPPKAHRWVGEMEEIAATLAAVGLTPRMLEGAAEMYRWVATTAPGQETPEQRQPRNLEQTIAALATRADVATASGAV